MKKYRIETDSLGKIEVEDKYYWGSQTQRAINNFNIGPEKVPTSLIHSLALIKKVCAIVNFEQNLISESICNTIQTVTNEIINKQLMRHFPLTIWTSGSGTQINMNINEVIANRANEILGYEKGTKIPVHPNDHVNCSQSSNDVFPSAMHITTIFAIKPLINTLNSFNKAIDGKVKEFKSIIKIGRTHLQDATPLTLGQEFSAYSFQIKQSVKWIEQALPAVYELAIGGSAVGTGINAPKNFGDLFVEKLNKLTHLNFTSCPNKFSALATNDALTNLSGCLNNLAITLHKIISDIRLLASGPRCGFSELILPANEPGSSIMPGKVNPTQIESLIMVCYQVMANHKLVALANMSGQLQLNVCRPVLIYSLLQSINLLNNGISNFANKCFKGIKANKIKIKELADSSLMLVTILNQHIGYDQSAKIAMLAHEKNLTIKEAAVKLKLFTEDQFDQIMDLKKMI